LQLFSKKLTFYIFYRLIYIDKISETYGISKEAIYGEINKLEYANLKGEKVLNRSNAVKQIETR